MDFKPTHVIQAMIDFNQRVLYDGTIQLDQDYTMSEVRKKLFFTRIAYENLQELFQRWDTKEYRSAYHNIVRRYFKNVLKIIAGIENMTSFEYCRSNERIPELLENMNLHDNLNHCNLDEAALQNKRIYFVTKINSKFVLRWADDSMYRNISIQLIENGILCKADDALIQYLNSLYGEGSTIAFRVSIYAYNGYRTKIECNGTNMRLIRELADQINPDAYVFQNPFIFLDDIVLWLNIISLNIREYMQNKRPMKLGEVLQHDMLHSYPEDSFTMYLDWLKQAAESQFVESIKVTMYRVGDDQRLINILTDAAKSGKYVHVNIELLAFGEESTNLRIKHLLEEAGVYVTNYAWGKLKVHSKTTLITFVNGIKMAQIGTGNYHTKTTSQYTDLSYFTSDDKICKEVDRLFDQLRGSKIKFKKDDFLVTQSNSRRVLTKLIRREAEKKTDGYICIKCNALDDKEIIRVLHEAEDNGCHIDLIIRGMNKYYPTERTVSIKSFIWDKLEHSRVFCFGKKNPKLYLGSLDLVQTKLDHRIESMVAINEPLVRKDLINYLNRYVTDTTSSWERINSTGLYVRGEDEYFDALQEYDVDLP